MVALEKIAITEMNELTIAGTESAWTVVDHNHSSINYP